MLTLFELFSVSGFESPFAIQDHHVSKVQNDQSGTDLKPQQLEFILKRRNLQQSTIIDYVQYMYIIVAIGIQESVHI